MSTNTLPRGIQELVEKLRLCPADATANALWITRRYDTIQSFRSGLKTEKYDFVAMWLDSEDPVVDNEATWTHLKSRDNWNRPDGATAEQVLLLVTCMETLIVADRAARVVHYGSKSQESALPPTENLEGRDRHDVLKKLIHATRNCSQLPSFKRARRILEAKL